MTISSNYFIIPQALSIMCFSYSILRIWHCTSRKKQVIVVIEKEGRKGGTSPAKTKTHSES